MYTTYQTHHISTGIHDGSCTSGSTYSSTIHSDQCSQCSAQTSHRFDRTKRWKQDAESWRKFEPIYPVSTEPDALFFDHDPPTSSRLQYSEYGVYSSNGITSTECTIIFSIAATATATNGISAPPNV